MSQSEATRLRRLQGLGILDTPPEDRFDRITQMASDIFEAPIALVSIVDADRQWFKSKIGLDVSETPRSLAFCAYAINEGPNAVVVVEDAAQDVRFATNSLVTGEPGIRFYAGATLTTLEGDNLGTLCVIDKKPRLRPPEVQLDRLRALAAMVVDEIELSRKNKLADHRLALLQLSEAMSGVGYWQFDVRTSQVVWSDQVYAIYGVDKKTFDPNLESVLAAYHPEDRSILEELIERSLKTGEGYSIEMRITRADGDLRRVVAKAIAELDSHGEVVGLTGVFQDITDYARAREVIAESEARYRLLAEAASDVVLKVDSADKIEYVSPSIKRFGWSPEEMIGRTGASFIHPEDTDRVLGRMNSLKQETAQGADLDRSYRMRKADGAYVWIEESATVLRDAQGAVLSVVCQLRDVSDRRETAKALADSEARYRMIADNTTDVIGRISLEGVIRYVSPAVERLLGYTVTELEGRKSLEFAHPEDVARVVAAFRDVVSGRLSGKIIRYRMRHKATGEWIWVEANPRLVIGLDGEPEFIDTLRDARAHIALEESMLRARSEAEAGARAKSDFLANMSHEIRTPLNGIVGYSALLLASPDLPAKYRRHADIISMSSKGLVRIVDDVLDLSALDAGEVSFEMRPFELRSLLRNSINALQVQASTKKLDIKVEIDPRLAERFVGDDARIGQVLINLLGNAIKFTPAGIIEIRCEPVSDGSKQTLRCSVRDTGIGIAAGNLGGLFSRFTQADSTISRKYGGTGLGLAITRKIVLAMGGDIGVKSEEGSGSTFWFALPLCATETPADLTLVTPQDGTAPHLGRKRILLVDDHDINRELAATMLSPMGHEVVLASSGEEAVQLVQKDSFDLVFMDVQMPGLDGLAATRAIRASESEDRIPIIALTAHAMRHQVEECLRAGMNGHVAKPFTGHALQDAILRWAGPNEDGCDPDGGLEASAEMLSLRNRFIARAAEDASQLRHLVAARSPAAEDRLKAIVHRLAGTAGSLGFHQAGNAALAIDSSVAAGSTVNAADVETLLQALETLNGDA